MSYMALAMLAVVLAVVLDRWVARTRVTSTRDWWSAYAIIVFFQLLTNGWLTGRRIVQYDPDTIVGSDGDDRSRSSNAWKRKARWKSMMRSNKLPCRRRPRRPRVTRS